MPIVSYDTDAGLGYGGKAFFLNYLNKRESFDITLFNSTKGERWYRIVFSIPDFELRQGTEYPWALDIIFDYDKYIKANFFGTGAESSFSNREYYTFAPFEASIVLSRGFTRALVLQTGIQFGSISNSNFESGSRVYDLNNKQSRGTFNYAALLVDAWYDSRNSYINPSAGTAVHAAVKYSPSGSSSFINSSISSSNYTSIFSPSLILAVRGALQTVSGKDLPIQALISSGGNRTLRGYVLNRYLSKVQALANAELRFLIYKRLGAVAGIDLGRPAGSISELSFSDWPHNAVFGLR